jgi:hypothetical protein
MPNPADATRWLAEVSIERRAQTWRPVSRLPPRLASERRVLALEALTWLSHVPQPKIPEPPP